MGSEPTRTAFGCPWQNRVAEPLAFRAVLSLIRAALESTLPPHSDGCSLPSLGKDTILLSPAERISVVRPDGVSFASPLLPDPSGKPPAPDHRHTDLVKSGRLTGALILAGRVG